LATYRGDETFVSPENVLASDRATITRFPVFETQMRADRSAHRQKVLRAIETALTKARTDAEAVEHPVLSYFLDMAIAEIQNGAKADGSGSSQQKEGRPNAIRCVS
jgi:hypothetical protein